MEGRVKLTGENAFVILNALVMAAGLKVTSTSTKKHRRIFVEWEEAEVYVSGEDENVERFANAVQYVYKELC